MGGATKSNLISKSVDLFEDMLQRGIRPDIRSYNTMMHAFHKTARFGTAKGNVEKIVGE